MDDTGNGTNGQKVINTALCSFGLSGRVFHAPFIAANKGFRLYAVWERSEKNAASLYPGIRSYDSLDALLTDEAIDLVVVNTPNHTHYEFTRKALLAGKDVLVEKSFTVTLAEACELVQMAAGLGRKLVVFHNRRYDSDFRTVKKVVEDGLLGEIFEASFHFERYKPEPGPKMHKELDVPGAGLLHDLGPHLIDQALYLFGMPKSVFGTMSKVRPRTLVNDHVELKLFYEKLRVKLRCSLMVKEQLPGYIIHGTNGSFIKERADKQEDMLRAGNVPGGPDWGAEPLKARGILNVNGEECIHTETLPGNYMEFYDRLYEALVFNKDLPVSAADGRNVMAVIEAAIESDSTGKVVSIS